MHIHNNSVLHYLYNVAVDQSIQGQDQGLTSLVSGQHISL